MISLWTLTDSRSPAESDLNSKMEYYASGETVDITVYRADNGEYVEKTISVTLGSRSNK